MTYNIRYDNPGDSLNSWDYRKDQLINLVSFYEPDFMGTQEALFHQLKDMDKGLENMRWIGVGRTDGKSKGEFSALFYNADKYELVDHSDSTIWLSETPSKPSKSWDAALPRIVTWGTFRNKSTGSKLLVCNTHFDHIGDTARAESAKLIVETIHAISGKLPVVLTGDFNVEETSLPYKILTDSISGLNDAFYESELPHVGPLFTYSGFSISEGNDRRRIDYLFINHTIK